MSNLQLTAVILATLIGIVIEFFLTRKMLRALMRGGNEYFIQETWAGGGISAWTGMLASVPGIGMLIALHWLLDVEYAEWMIFLIGAAFFITLFAAIFGKGIRPPKEPLSN